MARNSHACTIQEEHRCGWHCTTEHVIGNMYRCLSSGNVHICDANCNQRMDYGPNEEICYVSRKIFPKQVACQPSRKRQLSPDAKAAAADLWRQQGPHKQRYMPITPDHTAPLCRPALISQASPFGR